MRRMARAFMFGTFTLASLPACAQAQPPIQSAQDAACRDQAAQRVFSAPNPKGLGLYAVGRQIWQDCMRRAERGRNSHVRSKRST
jgi:hypothetical protein